MKRTKVFVAVPTTGSICDGQVYALRDIERNYADQIELIYPEKCVQRKFHDYARNGMVEEFLASEADIMWFLDSDIIPAPHVLDLVTKYGEHWELAGAPYPVFMSPKAGESPQVVYCIFREDAGGLHAASVPMEGQEFVDGIATGCIFIKREIFAQLERPFFEFKFDEQRRIVEGEDLGFCRKVNALGYKFFTDYSMVCAHFKTVNLLDVNNYAVDYAKKSIAAYDAQVRPQMVKLAEAVDRLKKQKTEEKPKSSLILPEYLK
jgi:hypothetical protein